MEEEEEEAVEEGVRASGGAAGGRTCGGGWRGGLLERAALQYRRAGSGCGPRTRRPGSRILGLRFIVKYGVRKHTTDRRGGWVSN